MTCPLCDNRGVIRVGYQDEPDGCVDFGICSCARGQLLRLGDRRAALAAKFGVSDEQVNLVEELLDPQDFPLSMRPAPAPLVDVAEAGRMGPRKARL